MNRKSLMKGLEVALISLMSILVVNVLWQVFSRYILQSPSSFTEELARFLMIWIGLLGAAYITGEREHIALDVFLQSRKGPTQKRLKQFISLSIILFAIAVLMIGGGWLVYTRHLLDVRSTALNIPMGWVYTILPLSGILIIYFEISLSLEQ